MREKNVLNDDEWTGWLHWMKNCFKYGTIGEQWEQIRSEGWLNPAFENFVNREIMDDAYSLSQMINLDVADI